MYITLLQRFLSLVILLVRIKVLTFTSKNKLIVLLTLIFFFFFFKCLFSTLTNSNLKEYLILGTLDYGGGAQPNKLLNNRTSLTSVDIIIRKFM